MKKYFFLSVLFIVALQTSTLYSQAKKTIPENTKPKLVVGIVVDQMRNDYLYRYWDRYGNGGFKRLVNNGYYFKNAHYNYIQPIPDPDIVAYTPVPRLVHMVL